MYLYVYRYRHSYSPKLHMQLGSYSGFILLSNVLSPLIIAYAMLSLVLSSLPSSLLSLSMSQSPDHPWVAVGLQPGTLFTPQGNKSVHLYNWKEKKLYQIFDAGEPLQPNLRSH